MGEKKQQDGQSGIFESMYGTMYGCVLPTVTVQDIHQT